MKFTKLFLVPAALFTMSVYAHGNWKPSQEMMDACMTNGNKMETGAACTFKGKKGHEMKGTCQSGEGTNTLFCKADHHHAMMQNKATTTPGT